MAANTITVKSCKCGHKRDMHQYSSFHQTIKCYVTNGLAAGCPCREFAATEIVCYLCTFEPTHVAGDREICGCTGLVTLLERAGMLAKLTW